MRQKAELEALAKMSDDDIDFSDIPAMTEATSGRPLVGLFAGPRIHLDRRVVDWFNDHLGESGSLMVAVNHALLDYIASESKKSRKKEG